MNQSLCISFCVHQPESILAMSQVGYMPQCCRSPVSGNANTPFNHTCQRGGGALGFETRWLPVPLLFDMSVDVGQENPLTPGTSRHTQALAAVTAALRAHNASLHDGKLQSVPDYKHDLTQKVCCNPNNVVCRCKELP